MVVEFLRLPIQEGLTKVQIHFVDGLRIFMAGIIDGSLLADTGLKQRCDIFVPELMEGYIRLLHRCANRLET